MKTHHRNNTNDLTICIVRTGLGMRSFSYCVTSLCVWLMCSQWQHQVVKTESLEVLSALLTHSHGWCLCTMATTSVEECSSMNSGCSLLPSAGTSKYYTNYTNVKNPFFTTESPLKHSRITVYFYSVQNNFSTSHFLT